MPLSNSYCYQFLWYLLLLNACLQAFFIQWFPLHVCQFVFFSIIAPEMPIIVLLTCQWSTANFWSQVEPNHCIKLFLITISDKKMPFQCECCVWSCASHGGSRADRGRLAMQVWTGTESRHYRTIFFHAITCLKYGTIKESCI